MAEQQKRAIVIFAGSPLLQDDGIGPAAYAAFQKIYRVGSNVDLLEVGCMTMDLVACIRDYDLVLSVDAVEESGQPAGTVFRYPPDAMARHTGATTSLHDTKLVNLFDAAMLLGYQAEGFCVGMQVEDAYPQEFETELSEPCAKALPLLVDAVAAELHNRGFEVERVG